MTALKIDHYILFLISQINKVSINKIQKLIWDSDFFGFKIGKIFISKNSDFQKLNKAIEKSPFEMVQVFSEIPLQFSVKPIDIKLTFIKKICGAKIINQNIKSYHEDISGSLIPLAKLAGVKSRYKIDDILNFKFEEMYSIWINESLSRKLADEVYVYEKKNLIRGMITIKENTDNAKIGLLAVSKESRGTGLGTLLLESVEGWAFKKNIKHILVSTQKENIDACNFYRKNDFSISNKTFIYHIWNK